MRFLKETVSLLIFTLTAHAQILNPSFETWTSDCELNNWAINSICEAQFSVRPLTRTTNAQSGQFAIRGEVVTLFGAQTIQPTLQSGVDGNGFSITQDYTAISGYFRFAPVSGDRMTINVILTKGDIDTGTAIRGGATNLPAATAYTPFTLALTSLTNGVPDRAYIQISVIGPVAGNDYHLGSVFHIDNLSFGGGTSTNTPEPRLTITRNPNNVVTVSWPLEVTGFSLQQTTNLNAVNWQNTPGLTATNRSHTLTPTANIFFRLLKP